MDAKRHVELLTTPAAESVGTLVLENVKIMREAAALMDNALENEKILVVGREAQRIKQAADLIVALLSD